MSSSAVKKIMRLRELVCNYNNIARQKGLPLMIIPDGGNAPYVSESQVDQDIQYVSHIIERAKNVVVKFRPPLNPGKASDISYNSIVPDGTLINNFSYAQGRVNGELSLYLWGVISNPPVIYNDGDKSYDIIMNEQFCPYTSIEFKGGNEYEVRGYGYLSFNLNGVKTGYTLNRMIIENWNTDNIFYVGGMFANTSYVDGIIPAIKELDISSLEFPNLPENEDLGGMIFSGLGSAKTIKIHINLWDMIKKASNNGVQGWSVKQKGTTVTLTRPAT